MSTSVSVLVVARQGRGQQGAACFQGCAVVLPNLGQLPLPVYFKMLVGVDLQVVKQFVPLLTKQRQHFRKIADLGGDCIQNAHNGCQHKNKAEYNRWYTGHPPLFEA